MIYDATITSKFQATVPKEVRAYLGISQGDHLVYELDKKKKVVTIRKAQPKDLDYLIAVEKGLSEWESPYDEESYGNL